MGNDVCMDREGTKKSVSQQYTLKILFLHIICQTYIQFQVKL